MAKKKPWQGRFTEMTAETVERFTESVSFDHRLYDVDIQGSVAHARMLGKRGIIPARDSARIIAGLKRIGARIESGRFPWDLSLEDVHMNIEAALTSDIGAAGARLHAARSRNDQIATDLRLLVRTESEFARALISYLLEIVLEKAEKAEDAILPGYTHMQKAQPVLLAHHLLAWFEMFRRDCDRFAALARGIVACPLGAGALAGTTLPIDRQMTAAELGFARPTRNSMDSVADRDFVAEYLFAAALCQVHLSRLAEEIVLWSTPEFGFMRLSDAHCTGSSMMPQKKNPDVAELVRGKTGRMVGNLTSLLVTLKGLPLTYNRDLQEDKEPLFDAIDTLAGSLTVMAELLDGAQYDTGRMRAGANEGFLTATDLADYLVVRGIPFRDAHEVVGRIVRACLAAGKSLPQLTLAEFKAFHPAIGRDVYRHLTLESSVARRDLPGGTAPRQVKRALSDARDWLADEITDGIRKAMADASGRMGGAKKPKAATARARVAKKRVTTTKTAKAKPGKAGK
jgi:argininosuccinate lyase